MVRWKRGWLNRNHSRAECPLADNARVWCRRRMRIVIMYNPVSGSGRSAAAADRAAHDLAACGHDLATVASRMEPTRIWLDPVLQGAELLVVAGGDGAMRLAAPAACRNDTPVYHLPLGTENLFAREFGMNAAMPTLLRAIERRDIRRVDLGVANARWFLLMASVGFDAEVVHTLAARRGKSISHFTYIKPILHALRTWRPPVLTVEVGGDTLVSAQPGIVVVANSRQYGWRIDPAGRAAMSDGLLDIVFLPVKSIPQLLMWVARCRSRRQFQSRSLAFAQGKDVLVRCDQPQHYQLDGDPPGVVHELLPEGLDARGHERTEDETGKPLALRVSICPGLLPVLTAGKGP